jgi:PTS system nitrogen regulatory IIA component
MTVPTLRLADYLQEDLVLWDLPSADKSSFLEALADQVAVQLPAVEAQPLLARLLEREAEQSTGLGGGVALPHTVLPELERTHLIVARPREGLDFAAADARPVDVVFLLLSPPDAQGEHLRLLARLARIFAPEQMLERLRGATRPAELYRMLLEEDARHVY